MANKLVRTLSILVLIAGVVSFVSDNATHKSAGGPPYNTNAPGEKTCSGAEGSSNSCHSGGIPDNSGIGTPNILFSGGSVYVPGQTYTITPTISHATRNRFGFQIVSLKDADSLFTGSIVLLDSTRTQSQQPTYGSYQDRIFVMHQLPGTYPGTPNLGQWSYKWTAPLVSVGNISFYACFLAANNNNTNDSGDETYWKKITISPSAVSVHEWTNAPHLKVFPNPATKYFYLTCYLYESEPLVCELLDAQGRLVRTLITETLRNGLYQRKVMLDEIEPGFYFVKSKIGHKENVQKILVQ
jgi:hypothetical protein